MARHDESTERRNGLFNDDDDYADEEPWPESPQPSWLADIDSSSDASGESSYADTQRIPSYDLGPHTESVVVDLTSVAGEPEASDGRYDGGANRYPDGSNEYPASANGHDHVDLVQPLPYYHPPAADPEPSAARHAPPYGAASASSAPSAAPAPAASAAPAPAASPAYPSPQSVVPPAAAVASEPPPTFPAPVASASPVPGRVPVTALEPPRVWNIPPVPDSGTQSGAESLTAASILRTKRTKPQSGWRKAVLSMSGGKINFGPSPSDRRKANMLAQARTPIRGSHRVAVISLKGGVGKTTTTAALGSMFADLRGDRVIAVDANPDRGTLSERVTRESGATIRHLLQARHEIKRYGDVRAFTSQSSTRLEVLASDSDPGASSALSERDYIETLDTLERFYNLVLTDCGTGLLHDAMRGVLGLASSLVVVSSASLDGARSASATLDWLEAHGLETLAQNAVVVISSVRPGGGIVDVLQLEDHFANRCREVVTIPYDPHLEAGSALHLEELQEETVEAYLELAAAVGEGFALAPVTR